MELKDVGKVATCGVSGSQVIVSKYNYKCPCLNCSCYNDETQQEQCQWRHVMETNPCTNEDIREMMCINCIQANQEQQR